MPGHRVRPVAARFLLSGLLCCLFLAHGQAQAQNRNYDVYLPAAATLAEKCRIIAERYAGVSPTAWGEYLPGVYTHFAPSKDGRARVALTLDACGGGPGNMADLGIINFLKDRQIKATLFLNARWIDANPLLAAELAANPLFELENHGARHRPLSVSGQEIYGIRGTDGPAEAAQEVEAGALRLLDLTGRRPLFFRSGTAYYDDVAVEIIAALGYKPAGFSVVGDAGGTLPAPKVAAVLNGARDGDIVILHMNRPESGTREGMLKAIPEMQARGVIFVHLADVPLRDGRPPGRSLLGQ